MKLTFCHCWIILNWVAYEFYPAKKYIIVAQTTITSAGTNGKIPNYGYKRLLRASVSVGKKIWLKCEVTTSSSSSSLYSPVSSFSGLVVDKDLRIFTHLLCKSVWSDSDLESPPRHCQCCCTVWVGQRSRESRVETTLMNSVQYIR